MAEHGRFKTDHHPAQPCSHAAPCNMVRMPRLPLLAAAILLTPLLSTTQSATQSPTPAAPRPLMLITWFGPGAIALPNGPDWKPQSLTVYDKGTRPVAQLTHGDVAASFIVFENQSGTPTAQGCRADAIEPIVKGMGKQLSKRVDSDLQSTSGDTLATTTYLVDMAAVAPGHHQRDSFAFAGNAKTCAEIHVSTVLETTEAQAALTALLTSFHPDLTYQPTAMDYFRLANNLFKPSPASAAPYYKSALDALPDGAETLTPRRIITDQLVMSLGMAGDLKNSRAVAELAAKSDPDYPLNYYNLACADAEAGNAADAKAHLQQAFDRRANVLKGESLPDPTKDDSLLKLKKNKDFWTFVESLPKS